MALVTVKLFGVLRVDTRLAKEEIAAETLDDVFYQLNEKAGTQLSFQDAIVYIDGKRTTKKHCRLKSGEEIWLMSPASGG